jgi:hypothetical protein
LHIIRLRLCLDSKRVKVWLFTPLTKRARVPSMFYVDCEWGRGE